MQYTIIISNSELIDFGDRVLEVFEGISARELLQRELRPDNELLIESLTEEFKTVKQMFRAHHHNVPNHRNMPPTFSKLVWVSALSTTVGRCTSKKFIYNVNSPTNAINSSLSKSAFLFLNKHEQVFLFFRLLFDSKFCVLILKNLNLF